VKAKLLLWHFTFTASIIFSFLVLQAGRKTKEASFRIQAVKSCRFCFKVMPF